MGGHPGRYVAAFRFAKRGCAFHGGLVASQQGTHRNGITRFVACEIRETAVGCRQLGGSAASRARLHQRRRAFYRNSHGVCQITGLAGSNGREGDCYEQQDRHHRRQRRHTQASPTGNAQRVLASPVLRPLGCQFLTQGDLRPEALSIVQTSLRERGKLHGRRKHRGKLLRGLGIARQAICHAFPMRKPC